MTMKITRIETIWLDEQPNTTWVRIHTDDGLIGLGETFYVPSVTTCSQNLAPSVCAIHNPSTSFSPLSVTPIAR